ncbi:MAG: apolipoprotein N-acyltransferase [Microthrixaceae bacterium]
MADRLRTALLALVAGLLVCFAMPPWGWWPLAPAGIALWLHLLADQDRRGRFLIGWMAGIGWFGPSTLWMWGLTAVGYPFGVVFGWGLMVAVTGVFVPADRRRFLVLPAALLLYEWFHSHAPFGGVPLSMLGMTQIDTPVLMVARLGGVLVVGAVVSALGVALYLALEQQWKVPVAIVAVVLALSVAGALWPVGDPVDTVTVAAVQGGGPQGTRFASGQEAEVFNRHLEATRTIPDDSDVDLVVWPENAINVEGDFVDHPWLTIIQGEAARIDAPIAIGVVDDGPTDEQFENYVLVVQPDGELGDRFDKERRVPFGEYTPLRPLFEPIAGDVLPPRDQVPGEGTAVIDTDAGPMAVVISWEVFFSRRVREGVREGGQAILNPTNGSSYWLTQVQTQQIATSRLRAVESGRWLVQVSPTGFSAFVDPDGGVHQRTDVSEQRVITRSFDMLDSTTPAQALGSVPALLLASLAIGLAQWRLRPEVRSRSSESPDRR